MRTERPFAESVPMTGSANRSTKGPFRRGLWHSEGELDVFLDQPVGADAGHERGFVHALLLYVQFQRPEPLSLYGSPAGLFGVPFATHTKQREKHGGEKSTERGLNQCDCSWQHIFSFNESSLIRSDD